MHNSSSYRHPHQPPLAIFYLLSSSLFHGISASITWFKNLNGVMFIHHVSTSLSIFLLLLHVSTFILIKIFSFLHHRAVSKGHFEIINTYHDDYNHETSTLADDYFAKEDLVADVLGGESLFFWTKESSCDDSILIGEVKDSKEMVSFEEEEGTHVVEMESEYYSPQEDLAHDQMLGVEHDNDSVANVSAPTETNTSDEDKTSFEENGHVHHANIKTSFEENGHVHANIVEEKKDSPVCIKALHPRREKFHLEEVPEDRENYGGPGSLTGESTSKSSAEWRSSETEYPFSSSSRRSSSRWESYTVFPKYNEGMVFLDRVSAQKLSETDSLRSIKVHPRSISGRIVHKLSGKPKNNHTLGRRNPYQELENAYVAQICLAWEALNWNYINFRQKNAKIENEGSGCPARIAQEFQQFQVLLQRFIENEPYEFGRRHEVYARRRISSPKLLQVPEFREADEEEDMSSKISSAEFLVILEDAIRTFMNFLKADKEKCSDIIKAFIKKKASSIDPVYFRFLKKVNRRKKLRIKDIGRRHRCIRKRKLTEEEEMEVTMALIDLKVVSRVLRMADISNEQLHWCEEKMSRVRVWDGKMQRDSSPLFLPVH